MERVPRYWNAQNPLPLLGRMRWGTPTLSPSTKTKATKVTATTNVAFPTCHTDETPNPSGQRVPWVAVRFPCRQVHHRHGLSRQATAGEMQRGEIATLHLLHQPDKGLRPGQQIRPFQDSCQDWLSAQTSQHNQVLSKQHEKRCGL